MVSSHRFFSDHIYRTHAPLVALIVDDAFDINRLPLEVQILRDLQVNHAF